MILMTFGVGIFTVITSFLAARLLVPQESGQDCRQDLVLLLVEETVPLWQENAAIHAELAERADEERILDVHYPLCKKRE